MEKLKSLFDSKVTWLTLGTLSGSLFGEQVAQAVGLLGQLVMTVL